jgi:hypothetical protein
MPSGFAVEVAYEDGAQCADVVLATQITDVGCGGNWGDERHAVGVIRIASDRPQSWPRRCCPVWQRQEATQLGSEAGRGQSPVNEPG